MILNNDQRYHLYLCAWVCVYHLCQIVERFWHLKQVMFRDFAPSCAPPFLETYPLPSIFYYSVTFTSWLYTQYILLEIVTPKQLILINCNVDTNKIRYLLTIHHRAILLNIPCLTFFWMKLTLKKKKNTCMAILNQYMHYRRVTQKNSINSYRIQQNIFASK